MGLLYIVIGLMVGFLLYPAIIEELPSLGNDRCPHCGNKIHSFHNYCPICGLKL